MTLTPADLDALDQALARMTPGPWEADPDVFDTDNGVEIVVCDKAHPSRLFFTIDSGVSANEPDLWTKARASQAMRDAAGIVALVNAAPALLAEVRRLLADLGATEVKWRHAEQDLDRARDELAAARLDAESRALAAEAERDRLREAVEAVRQRIDLLAFDLNIDMSEIDEALRAALATAAGKEDDR